MVAYEQDQKSKGSRNQEANAQRAEGEGKASGASKETGGAREMMAEPEPPIDLADQIDLEFSFHSPKALGQWQESIDEIIADLKRRNTPQVYLDGLKRGIGIHTESVKTQYRQAVEILFRRGYLR